MTTTLRRLVLAVAISALAAAGSLWILRGHPAPEHTLPFTEEDAAARAILDALRGRGSYVQAVERLGGRAAWITVHGSPEDVVVPVADAASFTAKRTDVLQVDIAIDPPFGASIHGPSGMGLDPGLDGAITSTGEVRLPSWFLERGMGRSSLTRYVDEHDASVLRTYAVVETSAGPRRLLLGALLPEPEVDAARLLRGASLGGTYLAAHVRSDNSFDYEIDASTGERGRGYNALRHAGATYALLQLYRQQGAAGSTPDPEVLRAGDKGLAWILARVEDDPDHPGRAFIRDGEKVKLGGAALALLALVERMRIPDAPPEVAVAAGKLARHLVSQQDARGRFASYYRPGEGPDTDARDSIYYPGEAVLALARYDGVAGDPEHRWRAAAEAGARFMVDDRHTALGLRVRTPVDTWLLLAIELLDRTAPGGAFPADDTLVLGAARIAAGITRDVYRDDEVPAPLRGSRLDAGYCSLISVGSRAEGLGAAAALEARHWPSDRRLRDAALANAGFGLRYQLDEDRLFLTAPKARALGGVPTRITDPEVRIDGVQHNLSGWLLLAAVLDGREPP